MPIVVRGMHGMGDNLHQRAVVRQLMERATVFLETPWPSAYHDLVGNRLRLLNKRSTLRTQAKNAQREAAQYSPSLLPKGAREIRPFYSPDAVRRLGSVLAAMMEATGTDASRADFRLPIAEAWKHKADAWIAKWQPAKPILVYRPLVERTEWGGSKARNPDFAAYAALLRSIRDRFFVVSVADLVPKVEWAVGENIDADVELHAGELDFETLAALIHRAAMVFASPGFAVPLAQAVGTPVVCVFGGYENSQSFSAGAKFTPYLGIDPISSCQCWSHSHACKKAVDMPRALHALSGFANTAIKCSAEKPKPRASITITAARAMLPPFPPRYFNPGELDILVHLIASVQPRVVIEFGCNEGRAAATILRNVPGIETYVGIDVLPGYVTLKECQRHEVPIDPGKFARDDPRFQLILRQRGAFDLSAGELLAADAVFIDADHSRLGVMNDYALAKAVIRPGGVIVFHDDNNLPVVEVTQTLDELAASGAEIVHVSDSWLAYERIAAL